VRRVWTYGRVVFLIFGGNQGHGTARGGFGGTWAAGSTAEDWAAHVRFGDWQWGGEAEREQGCVASDCWAARDLVYRYGRRWRRYLSTVYLSLSGDVKSWAHGGGETVDRGEDGLYRTDRGRDHAGTLSPSPVGAPDRWCGVLVSSLVTPHHLTTFS
jgi:hypothetical protein